MKVSITQYIINKIKAAMGIVQDTDTATQAISKGKYVWWKGKFKKATSAISQGATLSASNLGDVSEGALNELNSHIGTYDLLWSGDAHAVDAEMSLSHPITDYKKILFVFNVIPSRTPQFDVPADNIWYPEIQTHTRWDVSCYGCSIKAINVDVTNASKLYIRAYSKESGQTYTPGIVRIIGFKTY